MGKIIFSENEKIFFMRLRKIIFSREEKKLNFLVFYTLWD
jgi:hypothetical protein